MLELTADDAGKSFFTGLYVDEKGSPFIATRDA